MVSCFRVYATVTLTFDIQRRMDPPHRCLCARVAVQLISLKQMAKFTLQQTPLYKAHEKLEVYVPDELLQQPLGFVKPVVLYASLNNPGARQLAAEMQAAYPGIGVTEAPPASLRGDADQQGSSTAVGAIEATHFLLYLNLDTHSDTAGEGLATELRRARSSGPTLMERSSSSQLRQNNHHAKLQIVMAHENDPERGGCEFARILYATHRDLIDDGLYKALALACYPGEHRATSMALLAKAVGAKKLTGSRLRGTREACLSGFRKGMQMATGVRKTLPAVTLPVVAMRIGESKHHFGSDV